MSDKDNNPEYETMAFTFPAGGAPERIDRYIGLNPALNITRNKVQKLIKAGLVTVDGRVALHHQVLKGGEKVVIMIPPAPVIDIIAEKIPLEIVFEDQHLLVINKPAGMVTHPAVGNFQGTLVNALLNYSQNLSTIGGFDRPGIVHRLDKNTSGLILVAKNDEIHLALQQALQKREIKKTYWALICGHMKEEKGIIDLPVGRSFKDRRKMTVTRHKGREAQTEYQRHERFRLYDLLEINLLTGRTHQIRVHLSHLGHPVFGDPEYGGRQKWHRGIFSIDLKNALEALEIMPRQALHAKSLRFVHPVTGKAISLESKLPQDFQNLLDFLEKEIDSSH
ncbi:MAG: RluA family pseudouridine synthase [candidate division Zixibacteria bacterium]|nr:RluA family pseudouridine synthase [candidate division Zixibacteria bacterium]